MLYHITCTAARETGNRSVASWLPLTRVNFPVNEENVHEADKRGPGSAELFKQQRGLRKRKNILPPVCGVAASTSPDMGRRESAPLLFFPSVEPRFIPTSKDIKENPPPFFKDGGFLLFRSESSC